jgi:hypothetical protein
MSNPTDLLFVDFVNAPAIAIERKFAINRIYRMMRRFCNRPNLSVRRIDGIACAPLPNRPRRSSIAAQPRKGSLLLSFDRAKLLPTHSEVSYSNNSSSVSNWRALSSVNLVEYPYCVGLGELEKERVRATVTSSLCCNGDKLIEHSYSNGSG